MLPNILGVIIDLRLKAVLLFILVRADTGVSGNFSLAELKDIIKSIY